MERAIARDGVPSIAAPGNRSGGWLTLLIANLAVAKTTTAQANYTYTLGATGNRRSVAELSGRAVSYGYDDLYRLTSETITGAGANKNGAVSYVYDAVGNRKQLNSTLPAIPAGTTMFYDANDRISTDVYDNNGNTVNSGGIGNDYDFENRLIQHGAISIVYDGDGNRVSKTAAGVTTKFLVDTNSPTGYAQVLEELVNGSVVRKYTYGLSLISKRETTPAELSFYSYDGHGSVRQLTDPSGNLTNTYDYDAFGNLISQTGATTNNYLYSGEQYDPDLGLYYNRARYLDVRSGRFWGMDTYEGDPESPISLHRYLYAADSAVNLFDPSGNESLAESLTSIAVDTTLSTLAFSLPFRALQAAWKVSRGASLGTAAEDAALDVAKDVGFSLLTFGLFRYARGFTAVRATGEVLSRAAGSVWELAPFARGRAIEDIILAGINRLHPNFPVIDAFTDGIATSLKSLDLTAASYQSASALTSRLGTYVAKLSGFNGATFAGEQVLANKIKARVVLVAFEEGAATLEQAQALNQFLTVAAQQWPNVKVVFQFIP